MPIPHRDTTEIVLPRVTQTRPRPGFMHPLTRADIRAALAFFGPACWYGLHVIALARGSDASGYPRRFGSLFVPGRIVLYDQPTPPWIVPGALPAPAREHFAIAGAHVTASGNGAQTIIAWPGETLRQFFLWDVLMHEIGHHVLQYETGKRTVRIARTRDHEAFASRFARQCRDRYDATTRRARE